MAIVTERRGSGDGNRAGLTGSSATRSFDVHLTSGATDAVSGLTDDITDALTPIAYRYQVGTPHPSTVFSNLIVSDYEQRRVKGRIDLYIVKVLYAHPLVPDAPASDGWSIRITTATETAQMVRDLDGKWVGGMAYVEPETPEEGPLELVSHYADTVAGRKMLIARAGAVNPNPISYFKSISGLVITGTVYTLTTSMIRDARAYVAKVNDGFFYGANPQHCLLLSLEVVARPSDAVVVEQTGLKIAYDVQLEFLIKDDEPFTPVVRYDTLEFEGFESKVYINGGIEAKQTFRVYRTANFYNLFRIFGSSRTINNLSGATPIGGIIPVQP